MGILKGPGNAGNPGLGTLDARALFQFPENPNAMDLLVIQRPGAAGRTS